MSATPSATRPNLTADPSICLTAPGRLAMKASVLGSPCERLTATFQGLPRGGKLRVRIGSTTRGGGIATASAVRRPGPTSPRHINPSAGAPMMPSSGVPLVTSAILTVNSWPAGDKFLGAVERIDQEEAAVVTANAPGATRSSDSAGICGTSRARPSPMMRSAARSASVTGEPSDLPSIFIADAVDGEDGVAGPDHEFRQRCHQRGRGLAVDRRS